MADVDATSATPSTHALLTEVAVCEYVIDDLHVVDTELGRRYAVALSGRWEGERLAATMLPGSSAWNEQHGAYSFIDGRINLRLDSGELAFASYQGRTGPEGIVARLQIRSNDPSAASLNGSTFVQVGEARGTEGVRYTVYQVAPGGSPTVTEADPVRPLASVTYEIAEPRPTGARVVAPMSGRWEGPAISANVLAPSGDWLSVRPHGSETDCRVLLETDEGALVVVTYLGTASAGGASAGVLFETGDESLDRLNGIVGVATGSVSADRTTVSYDVFELRAQAD